jgi:hypothetical protein
VAGDATGDDAGDGVAVLLMARRPAAGAALAGAPRPAPGQRPVVPGPAHRSGRLANACRGSSGCDVATCRSNLVALGGPAAADRFVAAHERVTGQRHHPWWDVSSILEQDRGARTPDRLAVDEPRLAAAPAALTAVPPRR